VAARNQNVWTRPAFSDTPSFKQHKFFEGLIALQSLQNQLKNHAQPVDRRVQNLDCLSDIFQAAPTFVKDGFEQAFFAPEMFHQLRFACVGLAGDRRRRSIFKSVNRKQKFPCFQQSVPHGNNPLARFWFGAVHYLGRYQTSKPESNSTPEISSNTTLTIGATSHYDDFARASITSLVRPSARFSESRGIFVTSGLMSHPSPVGISRVSDKASHWMYTPPSFSSNLQYVFRFQR